MFLSQQMNLGEIIDDNNDGRTIIMMISKAKIQVNM